MSHTLSIEDLQRSDEFIKERIPTIEYETTVPKGQADAMERAALLYWRDVLDMEYPYIDSGQDEEIVLSHLRKAGVDLDAVLDANDDLEVEEAFLPSNTMCLRDFKEGLRHYALSDIASAWMANVRQAIEDVTGEDPLGLQDGLGWPQFVVAESSNDSGFAIVAKRDLGAAEAEEAIAKRAEKVGREQAENEWDDDLIRSMVYPI